MGGHHRPGGEPGRCAFPRLQFRRRTKTQASFGTEDAALIVLYGLIAFGHIQLRKIDGHQHLAAFLAKKWQNVA